MEYRKLSPGNFLLEAAAPPAVFDTLRRAKILQTGASDVGEC